jgi:glycosyltransferase involved in cell wall biosynthesis
MLLNPQPGDSLEQAPGLARRGTADGSLLIQTLARYQGSGRGTLLEVRCGSDEASSIIPEAERQGYSLVRADFESGPLPGGPFDVIVFDEALESARDPALLLESAHRLLKGGGTLLVVSKPPPAHAPDFRPDRLTWFDPLTIQSALHQADFRGIVVESQGGAMVALARAVQVPARRTLSVLVPAYNEAATVGPLLESLLDRRVPGLELEVVVVESNSTDGTRDVVRRYAGHPRVRLVLEDRPRGKGHAVRTALEHATGDYVLIQDADLEYDLEDYDALLEPLVSGREAFVLGARHGGGAWWKMRQFSRQPLLSLFFNLGHWFFTTLVNVLFGQRLKDPFTMFKVFRRDCLYGLEFRCNRFDFDYELLVKLIRKGYRPVEIPVNYRSRSFKEGKKVSTFRDPLTWLRALVWLRFCRIDPLAEIERRRAVGRIEFLAPAEPPTRAEAA